MNFLRVSASLALAALVTACASTQPYRTQAPGVPCEMKSFDSGAEKCAASTWERVPNDYDVLYVEFDDMGLSHPKDGADVGDAWNQIESTMQALNDMAKEGRRLNLVVFVHGWKHDARATDTNVREFHEILRNVSLIEKALGDGRVVGIFVGWRGLSATVEPFKEATFWARKNAALHVAQGSARHFLARLRAFQQTQNCKSNSSLCRTANTTVQDTMEQRRQAADADVRMIIIGHSFGGLIVFNAISEHLIESLVEEGDGSADKSHSTVPVQRFGDMVILINPAFEAVRYTPLQRVAARRKYDHYQAPILVTVTSTADIATRVFFRAGRGLNTLFEHEGSEEESEANVRAPGFVERYVTHDLTRCSPGNGQCNADEQKEPCTGWKETPTTVDEMKMNLALELEARDRFFKSHGQTPGSDNASLPPKWVRPFCGGTRLTHRGDGSDNSPYARNSPNSPIWNVRTDETLIRNHDDIDGAMFAAFIRQLFWDTSVRR